MQADWLQADWLVAAARDMRATEGKELNTRGGKGRVREGGMWE